jgi:hypothetical protein
MGTNARLNNRQFTLRGIMIKEKQELRNIKERTKGMN